MKKAITTIKKRKSGLKEGKGGDSPSQLIDARIKELSDWRGEKLALVRRLIHEADPDILEEWKMKPCQVSRSHNAVRITRSVRARRSPS